MAHDSHNLIVAGVSDRDMALAAETVRKAQGGIAVVKNGAVLGASSSSNRRTDEPNGSRSSR